MKYLISLLFIALISFNSIGQTRSCLKLNETAKSGNYFGGDITIDNTNVKGEISYSNQYGEGYSMSFVGTKSGENLTVQVTYSNDDSGAKIEQWTLNSNGLTTTVDPSLTLTVSNCN